MKPYSLIVTFTHGERKTIESGHNPTQVREAECRVARNTRVIARIELHDLTGCLETIWAADWQK